MRAWVRGYEGADAERVFQVVPIRFRPLFLHRLREKAFIARSFLVEQILNLFFWPPQAFKVVPYFSFHWCRVYVKLDLARRMHAYVPCAELRYLDDVRLKSIDRHFIENSDLATV